MLPPGVSDGDDGGPLAAALMYGGEEAGRETVERLTHIFGPTNVYVELQRHHKLSKDIARLITPVTLCSE
jgi:hypothetical protein